MESGQIDPGLILTQEKHTLIPHVFRRLSLLLLPPLIIVVVILIGSMSSPMVYQFLAVTLWFYVNFIQVRVPDCSACQI